MKGGGGGEGGRGGLKRILQYSVKGKLARAAKKKPEKSVKSAVNWPKSAPEKPLVRVWSCTVGKLKWGSSYR